MAKKDTDRRKKPQSGKERREDTRHSESKGRRSSSPGGKPEKRSARSSGPSNGRSSTSVDRSYSSTGRSSSQSGRPSAGRSDSGQSSQYRGRKDSALSNSYDVKTRRKSSSSSYDNDFHQERGGVTRRHNETVIGFHAIEETLKSGGIDGVLYVSGKGNRHVKITALAKSKNIRISKISDEALQYKYPDTDVRGIVLEVTAKKESGKETTLKLFLEKSDAAEDEDGKSLVMILDSITDPHNLGAILRSADQFGVDLVILPSRRSAGDNATVRKISSGASEHVPLAVENLSRSVDLLKKNGYWVYAADMGGDECWKLNLKGKIALILGSEGDGVSRILSEKCDSIIKIPATGHVDSFNVSVAAGILMYEAVRQQTVL